MKSSDRLTEIITLLQDAVLDEDWSLVERCIKDLQFLYETLELSFPFDGFDDDY